MTDTSRATDTPVPSPPNRLEQIKALIGDLARPFAIIITSGGATAATVIIALKNDDGFAAAAIFIGAVMAGVATLAGAKAYENVQKAKADATVQVAQAQATTPAP